MKFVVAPRPVTVPAAAPATVWMNAKDRDENVHMEFIREILVPMLVSFNLVKKIIKRHFPPPRLDRGTNSYTFLSSMRRHHCTRGSGLGPEPEPRPEPQRQRQRRRRRQSARSVAYINETVLEWEETNALSDMTTQKRRPCVRRPLFLNATRMRGECR